MPDNKEREKAAATDAVSIHVCDPVYQKPGICHKKL